MFARLTEQRIPHLKLECTYHSASRFYNTAVVLARTTHGRSHAFSHAVAVPLRVGKSKRR